MDGHLKETFGFVYGNNSNSDSCRKSTATNLKQQRLMTTEREYNVLLHICLLKLPTTLLLFKKMLVEIVSFSQSWVD